jgi:hypothetical protein
MGRTRYTNLWVPEGHTHFSSPWDSIRVADLGWVSKLQSLIFDFFKRWLLQSLTSSNFDFFNLWLHISSTSYIFDFKCNGQNHRVLESALLMGVKCWVYFLVLATDNGLKILFLALHWWSSQSKSWSGAWPVLPIGVAPEAMVGYL